MKLFSLIFSSALVGYVVAHGKVTSPAPRVGGAATITACGATVAAKLKSDLEGPIENSAKVIDSAYNATACHLYFCRGYQYTDNVSNTRAYTAGTVVPITVDIAAHHTGYANVSIVDLNAQVPIARLFTWPVYANDTLGPSAWPKNESAFEVTIPDLSGKCATAGACAIQWWWYAYNVQTFESCIDFTQA